MKLTYFVLPFLCAAMLSCGNSSSQYSATDSTAVLDALSRKLDSKTEETIAGIQSIQTTDTSGSFNETIVSGSKPVDDWDKKIIKTATIQTECKVYKTYNQQLHVLVKQYGGWLASESEVQEPNRINNAISIKVPVAQFEDLLIAINNLDGKTIQKNIATQDVTDQVIDTKGRIAVKKEMRDKYMNMLDRTSKMNDVLQVESKIDGIHEEIEMAATRLESLQHQSAYSTVNINYYQLIDVPIADNAIETPGIGSRILAAATVGASWLFDLLIGVISIWPLLLVFVVVFYYVRKRHFRSIEVKSKNLQD